MKQPTKAVLTKDINAYRKIADTLRTVKAAELKARKDILAKHFATHIDEGPEHLETAKVKLTASFKMARTIDQASLEAVWPDLGEEARNLITFKPSLNLSDYRKYIEVDSDGVQQRRINGCITMKPSLPSLKIEDL